MAATAFECHHNYMQRNDELTPELLRHRSLMRAM